MDNLIPFETIDGPVMLLPGAIFGFKLVLLTQQLPDGTSRQVPGTLILTPGPTSVVIAEHPDTAVPRIVDLILKPRAQLWVPGMVQ